MNIIQTIEQLEKQLAEEYNAPAKIEIHIHSHDRPEQETRDIFAHLVAKHATENIATYVYDGFYSYEIELKNTTSSRIIVYGDKGEYLKWKMSNEEE